MDDQHNSEGRKRNEALPLGQRSGLVSDTATKRTGLAERKSAGPDGPDATEIGNTFKDPKTKP
jgi:hypothetical protein